MASIVSPAGCSRDNVVRELYREAVCSGALAAIPSRLIRMTLRRPTTSAPGSAEPVVRSADGFEVSRYLYEVYRCRGDLQGLFPDLRPSAGPLVEWAYRHGRSELQIPPEVLPPREPRIPRRPAEVLRRGGVNVAGYFRSEFGVGEAARLLVEGLEAAGVPTSRDVHARADPPRPRIRGSRRRAPLRDQHRLRERRPHRAVRPRRRARVLRRPPHRRLLVVGGGRPTRAPAPGARRRRRGVGGSDYVRSRSGRRPGKPVSAMPVPSACRNPRTSRATKLGLPDGFLFLFLFDFLSSMNARTRSG